jgi:hypothetical protein
MPDNSKCCPYEAFILDGMKALREGVQGLQDGQIVMRDQLHAAVLDNTNRVSELNARVAGMETTMTQFRQDVRKDARRWGAVGGVFTAALAIIFELLRNVVWPRAHG